ncbi:MAG: hypothetical protein JSS98_06280 [Bacteroidetes bacterium]|nr:hypothetical protein [Bacteroidota bacterium]
MKKYWILVLSSFMIVSACKNNENIDRSDPLASARGFIESSLKGDYVKAQNYLLTDSTNKEYLNIFKDVNSRLTPLERENYRDANIIIDSTHNESDSVVIVTYSNTYKNEPTRLKMVKKNNDWLVDFKYTFLKRP